MGHPKYSDRRLRDEHVSRVVFEALQNLTRGSEENRFFRTQEIHKEVIMANLKEEDRGLAISYSEIPNRLEPYKEKGLVKEIILGSKIGYRGVLEQDKKVVTK